MPVRFQCPGCNKSLQADERLIGKTIKCPQCQSPFQIPSSPWQPPEVSGPFGSGIPGNQGFDAGPTNPGMGGFPQQPGPPGGAMHGSPYAPPRQGGTHRPYGPGHNVQKSNQATPASVVTTRVIGGILLFIVLGNLVFHTFSLIKGLTTPEHELRNQIRDRGVAVLPETLYAIMIAVMIVIAIFLIVQGLLAVQMIRLKGWGMALAACIMALIPCVCYSWIISFPVGVTGIVLLCQSQVKRAFH